MKNNPVQMKNLLKALFCMLLLVACGTSKKPVKKASAEKKSVTKTADLRKLNSGFSGKNSTEVKSILKDAEKYLGTPYKFAGNTAEGFDCSGLVCKVFDENGEKLPRRSSDQALEGQKIDIADAKPGDLVFFATAGGTRVSHVGIVREIGNDGEVTFIHSSTSKGVIVSSLNEKYWNKAYLFARRVL